MPIPTTNQLVLFLVMGAMLIAFALFELLARHRASIQQKLLSTSLKRTWDNMPNNRQ